MRNEQAAKLVVIGGGTGLPVLLRGLKQHELDLTAIVTVADDGGSSGRLRDELHIPPPGDVRNVLAALSDVEPLIVELFQHRFQNGNGLSGHSLGNLILAALTSITGDFVKAIREMSKVLNVRGQVLPAANKSVVLHAEMEDGSVVSGESKIPSAGKKIKRVFLTPEDIEPLPETVDAIRRADLIVIGPGSLYTSILPNLLVPKIGQEVCKAKAKKVYICNIMTQAGETPHYTVSDHVEALHAHLGGPFLDVVIINSGAIPEAIRRRYEAERAEPVRDDSSGLSLQVIRDDIVTYEDGVIRHNTAKVAALLLGLLPHR